MAVQGVLLIVVEDSGLTLTLLLFCSSAAAVGTTTNLRLRDSIFGISVLTEQAYDFALEGLRGLYHADTLHHSSGCCAMCRAYWRLGAGVRCDIRERQFAIRVLR